MTNTLPEQLVQEVDELREAGYSIDLVAESGFANAVIQAYEVPPGYNKSHTDLLLRLPMSYPNGKPDMFWTETDLTLKGGEIPKRANTVQTHLERQWRRFSWHPQRWNPGSDNLRTYLEFVNTRLAKAV